MDLNQLVLTDDTLRGALETLLEKERKTAQLELLLKLGGAGVLDRGAKARPPLPTSLGAGEAEGAGAGGRLRNPVLPLMPLPSIAAGLDNVAATRLTPGGALEAYVVPSAGGAGSVRVQDWPLSEDGVAMVARAGGLDASGLQASSDVSIAAGLRDVADAVERQALAAAAGGSGGGAATALSLAATPFRVLDVSWAPAVGPSSSLALQGALARIPSLEALAAQGTFVDVPPSGEAARALGKLLEAAIKHPRLVHLGVTLDEARWASVLEAEAKAAAAAAAAAEAAAAADGNRGRRGASAGAAKRGASVDKKGGAARRPGAGPAKPTAPEAPPPPPASFAQLTGLVKGLVAARAGGASGGGAASRGQPVPLLTSLCLAGSSYTRASFAGFLASLTPATAAGVVAAAAAAAAEAKEKAPGRRAPPAVDPRKAKKGSAAGADATATGPPKPPAWTHPEGLPVLFHLDVSRTQLTGHSVQDLAIALSDPAAPTPSVAALAHADTPGQGPALASVALPVPVRGMLGALAHLQVLNLANCGITTASIAPLLEAVAWQTRHLRVLILRGNNLDDVGAGALAAALSVNASRIAAARAAALAAPVPPAAPGRLPGLQLAEVAVVDVRSNPLNISLDARHHPGCAALIAALRDCPALLSLVGPDPSVEDLADTSKASHASLVAALKTPLAGKAAVPPPVGATTAAALALVRPDAIRAVAASLLRGEPTPARPAASDNGRGAAGASGAPRGYTLDMPPGLAHEALTLTLTKLQDTLAALRAASPPPPSRAPPMLTAWRLAGPETTSLARLPASSAAQATVDGAVHRYLTAIWTARQGLRDPAAVSPHAAAWRVPDNAAQLVDPDALGDRIGAGAVGTVWQPGRRLEDGVARLTGAAATAAGGKARGSAGDNLITGTAAPTVASFFEWRASYSLTAVGSSTVPLPVALAVAQSVRLAWSLILRPAPALSGGVDTGVSGSGTTSAASKKGSGGDKESSSSSSGSGGAASGGSGAGSLRVLHTVHSCDSGRASRDRAHARTLDRAYRQLVMGTDGSSASQQAAVSALEAWAHSRDLGVPAKTVLSHGAEGATTPETGSALLSWAPVWYSVELDETDRAALASGGSLELLARPYVEDPTPGGAGEVALLALQAVAPVTVHLHAAEVLLTGAAPKAGETSVDLDTEALAWGAAVPSFTF